MTTPALRAAALAMARLAGDNNLERRAQCLEEHARVAVVAWLRARADEAAARGEFVRGQASLIYAAQAAELDPPAGPIGENQDD